MTDVEGTAGDSLNVHIRYGPAFSSIPGAINGVLQY
jgi:hypothetical protein